MRFPSDMQDKDYRHGLIDAQIEIDLPFQIRALRKQEELTQPQLAELSGMKQSRISKMEKPGGARFTLETLRRLAKALDVALVVRFAPFGELVEWSNEFDPDSFAVPSFDEECQAIGEREKALQAARSNGKLVTIKRKIRWSCKDKRAHNPKHSSAMMIPRKSAHKGTASPPLPMPAEGERMCGRVPYGNNNTSRSLGQVGSGNGCTGGLVGLVA
jgi:transcriptional regulator with XRE-family HTH domain